MTRTGVVIANTGSPAAPTPEAVRSYLRDFLTDPRIRPMPAPVWNLVLKAFILPRRSVASAAKYASVWEDGGSPLDVRMRSLAHKLDAACGEDVVVRHAMSYGSPSMASALESLREAGCGRVVAVPLYPQTAFSTTDVVRDKLHAALRDMGWHPDVRFVEGYCDDGAYLDAVAGSVREAGFAPGDRLLVAFHSIPLRDVRNGDAYGEQAHETAEAVARRLGLEDGQWDIGFQSRFDKGRAWLGPFTSEVLGPLAEGPGRLFAVAPNFSVDCLETLYDIGTVLRGRVESERGRTFAYVPCLNDSEAQVELLRGIVRDGL